MPVDAEPTAAMPPPPEAVAAVVPEPTASLESIAVDGVNGVATTEPGKVGADAESATVWNGARESAHATSAANSVSLPPSIG